MIVENCMVLVEIELVLRDPAFAWLVERLGIVRVPERFRVEIVATAVETFDAVTLRELMVFVLMVDELRTSVLIVEAFITGVSKEFAYRYTSPDAMSPTRYPRAPLFTAGSMNWLPKS